MKLIAMKLIAFTFAVIVSAFATGCSASITEPTKTAATAEASSPSESAQWERRKLADGIELVVDPNAGPEAQRVAEMIQSEMRSRYIGAR
jgi:hypothetical protein